jgi:hypothetical protein
MTQLGLDFTAAKTRGDLGAERAAGKAERVAPGWIARTVEAVRYLAKIRPADAPFTIEQVRVTLGSTVPEPPDGRAWGHVTRRAVALAIIEPTGGYAPAASSNGSPKRLYRRGPRA